MNVGTERLHLPIDFHNEPPAHQETNTAVTSPEPPRVLSDTQEAVNLTAQVTASGVEGTGIAVTTVTEHGIGAVNASSMINAGHGLFIDLPVNVMHWLRARGTFPDRIERGVKRTTHGILSASGALAISEAGMTGMTKTAQLAEKTNNPTLEHAGEKVKKAYDTISGLPLSPIHGLDEKAPSLIQFIGAGMQPAAVMLAIYMLDQGVKDVYGSREAVFNSTDIHAKRIQTRYNHFFSDRALSVTGMGILATYFAPNYVHSPGQTLGALAMGVIGWMTMKRFPLWGKEFEKPHDCGKEGHGEKDAPEVTPEVTMSGTEDKKPHHDEEDGVSCDGHHPHDDADESKTTEIAAAEVEQPKRSRWRKIVALGAAAAAATMVGLLTNDTKGATIVSPSLPIAKPLVSSANNEPQPLDLPDSVTANQGDSLWSLIEERGRLIAGHEARDQSQQTTFPDAATYDLLGLTANLNNNSTVVNEGQRIVLPADDIFKSRVARVY